MKAVRMGLVTVWLSGFMLIVLSIFATQKLPTIKDRINGGLALTGSSDEKVSPRIVIFTAPSNFSGSVGVRQSTAIRSWLGLSSQIRVVLFSQDPDVVSFAQVFGPRVSVEPNIDFTFLGTPFFHSMVARSWAFPSDITVMIHPETILLPDFVSTLNFAAKLDHDWFLVASPRNVSHFPYNLDIDGLHWLTMDGRKMKMKELQEILIRSRRWNDYEERLILAWNNGGSPLHTGILPPFLYGKGIHNHWVINEAVLSKLRFVFDASRSISSFYIDSSSQARCCDNSSIEERTWEYAGNSHLGALYGSSLFQEANFTSITRLVKCKSKYLFVDTTDGMIHLFDLHENALDLLERRMLRSHGKKKMMSCVRDIRSQDGVSNWSLKNQLKQPVQLDFPFSLELLLSTLADKNKTIVLGVAGYSYKDMMMSWACRLRSLRITNFIVCALDSETFEFAILQGLPVFRDSSAPDAISLDDCHFGTKCFQKVTKVKSRIVLQILKLGYNVLLSDVDVYWFNNPLPLLSSFPPRVLVAQSDEFNKTGPINMPRRLNSGFYFARSDVPTIRAMQKVVKHAATSGLSEQPSFYDTLCGVGGSNRIGDDTCIEPETSLTVHFLDRDLFPNGAYSNLWENHKVKEACLGKGCLILHNNWISGRRKKLERQVLSGLWEYDISMRMCRHSWD